MSFKFITSLPLLVNKNKKRKNQKFTVKFDPEEVLEEVNNELNCEKCKQFYYNYLDLKNNSVSNNFKRWGFGIKAFCFETFQIRLNNDKIVNFSQYIKNALKNENFTSGVKIHHTRCLTSIAANISYYHFQSYVNPNNSQNAKKVFENRLRSFLNTDNSFNKIKDSWTKSLSDIYNFTENYIIIMEINIIIFLTNLSIDELFEQVFDDCCFKVESI